MASAQSPSRLRRFLDLTADLGVADGARLALREVGISTYQWMQYPGVDRKFRVRFDPVWRWIDRGTRERGLLRFSMERIREGDVVFDVGAHLGESSLLFSQLVGQSGKVVAFEPDPVACAILRKNLELNSISNVRVEELVVSDRTGKASLSTERLGSGLSSIVRQPPAGASRKEVNVESTTLDEYCWAQKLFPTTIKVDAEGAEPLVVAGMGRLISERHPSVVLEFHADGLSPEERRAAWSVITERAVGVEAVESIPDSLSYLEELRGGSVPDTQFLIIHLQY